MTAEAPAKRERATFAQFRTRHHLAFEVVFFFAGFLFDVVLLHRIDSVPLLIHQGIYLVLSAGLIVIDHRITVSGKEPEGRWGKIASYRLWVMHFFLGTLLNAFLVFYFRASSGFFAMVFIVLLAGAIVLNELPHFRKQGPVVRVALLSFAITSYLAYLIPVLWGELRAWQYAVALVVGSSATVAGWWLFRKFTHDPLWTVRRAVVPGLSIQAFLAVMYIADAVPPVPLSLKHIGLYHSVQREGGTYKVTYEPASELQFWKTASHTVHGALGDKVYAFVRVFAPTRFEDSVAFAWEYDDPHKGWTDWGKPFTTRLGGGNERGFGTFAYLTIQKPGDYRVRVLTTDGREIGRESFEVETVADASVLELHEGRE